MKKLSLLLVLTVFLTFYNPAFESTAGEGQAHLPSESPTAQGEAALLYSLESDNDKIINIFNVDNSFYFTSSAHFNGHMGELKEVVPNPSSTSKLLVNKDNPLPGNYEPEGLTAISSGKVRLEYAGLKLIPPTLNALYSMVAAARKDGVKGFIINSAYRSLASQQQIFDANLNSYKKTSKTMEEAIEKTRLLVALPGNSEHHTGLAIDIFSINGRHRDDFEGTREQVWLNGNLYKYGFIIRYPRDKTKETNSTYEPWHIRYVGLPLSSYMQEKNLCLEEFYNKLFSDHILESGSYLFMQVKAGERVFIDENLTVDPALERVNSQNMLLTVKKPSNLDRVIF